MADLCAHTAELSRAYFAALEQEARRVTPATERFRRGDRVNKAYGGKLSEDADDDEQQGGHDEDINSVIRRTREAEKMAKAHGRKAADTAVDALPDGPGDGLGAQLSVRERAIDLRRRGKVLASRGELLRACACFDAAIALPHDDVGNRERAVALVNRSAALQRRGRLEEALADARHAAQLDERSAAKALLAAAEAERALGRFRAAVRTCDRAMSKATPTERESEGLRALRAFCAREAEHAAPQLEAAAAEVRAAQESGDTTAEATALAKLGDLLRQQGDFGTAQEALEALLSLAVSAGDAAGESSACGALAAVCDAAGDDDAADEYRSRFVKLGFESARTRRRGILVYAHTARKEVAASKLPFACAPRPDRAPRRKALYPIQTRESLGALRW